MTVWFLPYSLTPEMQGRALVDGEIRVTALGTVDYSRAFSLEHLKERLHADLPDLPPEVLQQQADMWWQLLHEVGKDDYVVLPRHDQKGVMLGELISEQAFDDRSEDAAYTWRVRWLKPEIPLSLVPGLQSYMLHTRITEITDQPLSVLRRYIPALNKIGYTVFKWVSALLLLFELAYFWPH